MALSPRLRSLLALPFVPAIAVLDRLTFARKFILIGLLLSGPLAIVVWLQLSTASDAIEFNRRERTGLNFLEPARALLFRLQEHRVLTAAARAEAPGGEAALAGSTVRVGEALRRLQEADLRHGALLQTTPVLRELERAWAELAARPDGADDAEGWERVTTQALDLVRRAGNYSNLILDPDLDSYWLMDALVIKLPSLAQAVSRSSARCLAARSPAAEFELAADFRLETDLAEELGRVDYATAFRETARHGTSPTLQPGLEPPLLAAQQAVGSHADLLRRRIEGGTALPETVETARAALASLWRLEQATSPELDRLIQARELHHRGKRTQGLWAAAASAAVLCYLFIAIYLSVRSSVSAIREGRPALPKDRARASQDEIGQIAVAYTRAQDEKSRLEEQLRLADRLATIGTLAAGAAHELNEPLGAILGFAQLASKTPDLPEATTRDLGKIAKAALHAREVIKQLMLFARQAPPQKTPIDLRQVVLEALDILQPRCEQDGVAVVRRLDAAIPSLVADPAQLRQVVLNLVVNAVQATPSGGTVTVGLQAGSSQVALFVEDPGPGMSEDVQKQMFVPFFTTKEIGEGTGLGLSVVHGIVSAHGGTIRVDSSPGKGTRVEVLLPLAPPVGL